MSIAKILSVDDVDNHLMTAARENETSSFDEQKALILTLESFVQPARLRDALDSMDASHLDYDASHEVQFSNGDAVDLRAESVDVRILARRIYKTRNAVVHAKTGERSRFRPRTDDEALARELPLMRAVAEEILISSAKLLE